jgi:DNA-nicking Smr family endonuclease
MDDEPVPLPITHELDLHAFQPGEIGSLLEEYFRECRRLGIHEVRVIHGKGSGALRQGVHARLTQLDSVADWTWPAGALSGGWGATWVRLHSPEENDAATE